MTRLFCVMMVVVAAAFVAAPAWAAVPYPPNCTVTFFNPIDDSAIGICPNGDYTYIDVTVRDQFNTVMAGVTVTATFSDARVVLGGPVTGTTDGAGFKRLRVKGGVNHAGPIAVLSNVTVTCLAIPLATFTRFVYSPDYEGNQSVTSTDFSTFGDDWKVTMKDNHSDFERTNALVTNTDFAVFGSHWKHTSTFPTP